MTMTKDKKTNVETAVAKAGQKLVKTAANKTSAKKSATGAKKSAKPEVKLVSQTIPVELTPAERLQRLEGLRKMGDMRDTEELKMETEKARHKGAKEVITGEIERIAGNQRDLRKVLKDNREDRKLRVIEQLDPKTREMVFLDPKTKQELHRRRAQAHELQKSIPGTENTKPKPVKLEWKGITPDDPNQLVSVGGAYQVRYTAGGALTRGCWVARYGQETVADADGTIEWDKPEPAKAACQRHADAHPKPAAKDAPKPNGKGKALAASIAERKKAKAKQPRVGRSPLGPRPTSDPSKGAPLTEL
jgi:hypothetical protein